MKLIKRAVCQNDESHDETELCFKDRREPV